MQAPSPSAASCHRQLGPSRLCDGKSMREDKLSDGAVGVNNDVAICSRRTRLGMKCGPVKLRIGVYRLIRSAPRQDGFWPGDLSHRDRNAVVSESDFSGPGLHRTKIASGNVRNNIGDILAGIGPESVGLRSLIDPAASRSRFWSVQISVGLHPGRSLTDYTRSIACLHIPPQMR